MIVYNYLKSIFYSVLNSKFALKMNFLTLLSLFKFKNMGFNLFGNHRHQHIKYLFKEVSRLCHVLRRAIFQVGLDFMIAIC